jgi:anthranilate/para-aminobenzoate synthase component I
LTARIAIHSMLAIGGKGYVQAGDGIVANSVPELECQEPLNNAKAVMRGD